MIYDKTDLSALHRIIIRKSVEMASITMNREISEPHRNLLVSTLTRHLNLARVMSEIGFNNVAALDILIDIFEEREDDMYPVILDEYLESLGEVQKEDEGHFIWMTEQLALHMPFLIQAVNIDSSDHNGTCGITSSDIDRIQDLSHALERLIPMAAELGSEDAKDVTDYLHVVSSTISAIKRINLLKSISSEEISEIVNEMGTVDEETFDSTLLNELSEAETKSLMYFRANTPGYISSMYARCILNAKDPKFASLRDF